MQTRNFNNASIALILLECHNVTEENCQQQLIVISILSVVMGGVMCVLL